MIGSNAKMVRLSMVGLLLILLGAIGYDSSRIFGRFDSVVFRVWYAGSVYREIKSGMTQKQVRMLLGEPDSRRRNPKPELWGYSLSSALGGKRSRNPENMPWDYVLLSFGPDGRLVKVSPECMRTVRWPAGGPSLGMTRNEVRRIAGNPEFVDISPVVELWYYRLWNRTHFAVLFNRDGRTIRGLLIGAHKLNLY